MMRKLFPLLLFIPLLCAAQTIQIGEAELIYTEDEIPIRYDGSLSTIQKDENSMYFFHSFGCRLSEVLKDASKSRVGEWFKYRDGRWDTPGLSDMAGTGVIPLESGGEDVHSDAAWCTALGSFLLTVQTHDANELQLFSSTDGVKWKKVAVVDVAGEGEMQPYSSFVDYNGPKADCSEVDGSFYIYYPRKRLDDHEYDYMYRRLVTIK